MIDRAARLGYDLRAVERGLWALTPGGELALGLGGFDGARILDLLWERLLPPRRRSDGARGVARVEGRLGRAEVTAAVDGRCGLAAWSEGDTRLVDPALARDDDTLDDEPETRVLRGRLTPGERHTGESLGPLASAVRTVDITGDLAGHGLALTITLRGPLPHDVHPLLRVRVRRIAQSALLRAAGADAWCDDPRVRIADVEGGVAVALTIPWAAFDAIAEVLRGRLSSDTAENHQGF